MTDEVVAALERLGVSRPAIERAVGRGDPVGALFEGIVMPSIAERVVTPAEVEARGGYTVAETARIHAAIGLPEPAADEPAFTPEEADAWIATAASGELWPLDVVLQISRVYGRLLARIAQTEVQLFRVFVERRLLDESPGDEAALRAVRETLAALLPVADPVIAGIHHRWVEHELAQAAVGRVDGGDELPGSVEATFVFCDLKDFTAYSDRHGDLAALEAIERFSELIQSRRKSAKLTKALGDGFMLVFADAAVAVDAAVGVITEMRDLPGPGVHASAHHGSAILREGDYFGRSVNIAARLLGWGGRDELVVTATVRERIERDGFEAGGPQQIHGVSEPVDIFRLRL